MYVFMCVCIYKTLNDASSIIQSDIEIRYEIDSWRTESHEGGTGNAVVGSPGVGISNSSSSSSGASWRSGTPSPPLSDEGAPTTATSWIPPTDSSNNPCNASSSSSGSTPGSINLDEGIVLDYLEEQHPRKKKVSNPSILPRSFDTTSGL